jgi:hypothetical protein
MPSLNEILKDIWPKVRRKHLFPELPVPELAQNTAQVAIDMKCKKICISEEFVADLSRKLEPTEIIEGLLDHAVSHYLYCPWDFETHLKLYAEVKKVLNNKMIAQRVTDAFVDVVANTRCVRQTESPLPKLYQNLEGDEVERIVRALCQRIWGENLNATSYEDVSQKLAFIPYLNRSRWLISIRRFARLMQPYLAIDKQETALPRKSPLGCHDLKLYTREEIEYGLKKLANGKGAPSEFAEIIRDHEEEISEVLGHDKTGIGLGPGRASFADVLYYMKLAENYWLPLKKMPLESSGATYPHHHTPWEVGRPCRDIDPWTSFGKIMPGITQTWTREEGEIFGKEEKTPDCIVVIDSSSSMINPKQALSYAVLGAGCACDAYLRNNAAVAVYNFSDASAGGRKILPYSRQRHLLYESLCLYLGGGTRLEVEDIENLQRDCLPDIFLITDMQINNLNILIQYFNNCRNRITAVHIGENEHVHAFRDTLELRKDIGIYAVKKKEDIPRIIIGKVREFLYTV